MPSAVASELPIAARLAMRDRPPGPWLMRQQWRKLLFMHWPVPVDVLRPHIPARFEIDTFDGMAWLAVVPFTMSGIRPALLPPVPGLSSLHELNVRTYVSLNGVPGVWFFSLDASSAPAVWAARTFFHLPYFRAKIGYRQVDDCITYTAHRTHAGIAPADFAASWTIGAPLPEAAPGSLAFFLTERYCLYTAKGERLYRGRIQHAPWPLRAAELLPGWQSTLIESHGLPTPTGPPLLHYAEHVAVRLWLLQRVD